MISVRVTTPRSRWGANDFENSVMQQLMKEVKAAEALLKGTTTGWSEDVKWTIGVGRGKGVVAAPRIGSNEIFAEVYTRNYKYNLVNYGSFNKPGGYPIVAKNKKTLKFMDAPYQAATSPGSLSSRRPMRDGPYVYPKAVHHPGHEARRFDVTTADRIRAGVNSRVQSSLNRFVRGMWR